MPEAPGPDLARLQSVLAHLPCPASAPRAISVGCGHFPSAAALRAALPGWTLWGLDRDRDALGFARQRVPDARLICADLAALPCMVRLQFGLVLVRHPDLFRSRAWRRALPRLPQLLAPGGLLVITLFTPDEAEALRALALPGRLALDEFALTPPGLAGQDRFVQAYNLAG